jgi:hypothetical protein
MLPKETPPLPPSQHAPLPNARPVLLLIPVSNMLPNLSQHALPLSAKLAPLLILVSNTLPNRSQHAPVSNAKPILLLPLESNMSLKRVLLPSQLATLLDAKKVPLKTPERPI